MNKKAIIPTSELGTVLKETGFRIKNARLRSNITAEEIVLHELMYGEDL